MQPVQPIVEQPLPTEWKIPQRIVKRYGEFNLQALHSWWVAWGPRMMQGDRPLTYISGCSCFCHSTFILGMLGRGVPTKLGTVMRVTCQRRLVRVGEIESNCSS